MLRRFFQVSSYPIVHNELVCDFVSLERVEKEKKESLAVVDWETFVTVMQDSLKMQEFYPKRFLASVFPSQAQIKEMKEKSKVLQ